ncbi:F-box only protein 21-like [Balamuthia mandrillaris]
MWRTNKAALSTKFCAVRRLGASSLSSCAFSSSSLAAAGSGRLAFAFASSPTPTAATQGSSVGRFRCYSSSTLRSPPPPSLASSSSPPPASSPSSSASAPLATPSLCHEKAAAEPVDPVRRQLVRTIYSAVQRINRDFEKAFPLSRLPFSQVQCLLAENKARIEQATDEPEHPAIALDWNLSPCFSFTEQTRQRFQQHKNETDSSLIDKQLDNGFRLLRVMNDVYDKFKPWMRILGGLNSRTDIDQTVNIEDMAMTIAMLRERSIDRARVHRQLDEIAERVKERLEQQMHDLRAYSSVSSLEQEEGLSERDSKMEDAAKKLIMLNEVMFKELGFVGAGGDVYYRPENNFIDAVLEQKQGIPISLSVIYMAVGRRLGLALKGINAPFHFLLYSEDTGLYVDAYNGGALLTPQKCAAFLKSHAKVNVNPDNIVSLSVGSLDICQRMLTNLQAISVKKNGYDSEETRYWREHHRVVSRWWPILEAPDLLLKKDGEEQSADSSSS